jgi:hypothetical protein
MRSDDTMASATEDARNWSRILGDYREAGTMRSISKMVNYRSSVLGALDAGLGGTFHWLLAVAAACHPDSETSHAPLHDSA